MSSGQEERKPTKMVRSSIACSRCRRSKVKCVNTGVNSTCKACAQSNRECTYPVPGSVPTPKRADNGPAIKHEGEGESKKRIRKAEDSGRRNSTRATEDALDSPILTRKVWDEIYDLFKLHFSTELPFLHPPTFRNRMRQASFPRDPSISTSDLQNSRIVLLGVLTLTARFQSDLVAHHSPQQPSNPLAASEYYATALAAAFGPTIRGLANCSLEGIQALLMLGLYDWGQSRGLSAWLHVGNAIRLAQSMGLMYEDETEKYTQKGAPQALKNQSQLLLASTSPDDPTMKEVRRRTLWSCFIMDRMLSAGKNRPTMLDAKKLRVQLPCSDDQFLFVSNVQTGFLNPAWAGNAGVRSENDPKEDDGVLSRYIRLVEIFGRFSEWSYAGGRRTETLPPWDPATEFYNLRHQLETFHDSLPPSLKFTEANLSAHIEKQNSTTYTAMHTLYSLCLIMLHREYIPFIPIRCDKPQGPLDAPTFPPGEYDIPFRFWEDSAERICEAAKDIVDIVRTCQDNNRLPESPPIGFAVWQAAFVSIYSVHFPQMDPGKHLQFSEALSRKRDMRNKGYAGLTAKILNDMVPRLRMAKGYLKLIVKMHDYFQNVKNDYYYTFKRGSQPPFSGGGLEQYKLLEKELKEFGSLSDMDRNAPSDGSDPVDQPRSPTSSANGEAMQGVEAPPAARANGAWAAINACSPPMESEDRIRQPQGPFSYSLPPYQQSPIIPSNTPSLVGHSNGDRTPSLNSPYTNTPYHPGIPQHAASYPSVAQHSMAPPTTQVGDHCSTSEIRYERYMQFQESIRMNAGFDNMAQEQEWSEDAWTGDMPFDTYPGLNFVDALNNQTIRHWIE